MSHKRGYAQHEQNIEDIAADDGSERQLALFLSSRDDCRNKLGHRGSAREQGNCDKLLADSYRLGEID